MSSHTIIWILAIISIAGVIIRPFKVPEAVWAVSGALLLVATKCIKPSEAWTGVANGMDVYLFLMGMMLLAELAREEKLFDWMAAIATKKANGSPSILFILVYIVGTIVTAFLSNDATAVVLTPAVAAAMKAAKIEKPLPYLFICAFIANAASFILPISNPANLVIYGSHMLPLLEWLPGFLLPSLAAIIVTFFLLRWTQRKSLSEQFTKDINIPRLSAGGRLAGFGIILTGIVLLVSSAFDLPLGLPTAVSGVITTVVILLITRSPLKTIVRGISWAVLPLVAGLFVIVEALHKTGLIGQLSRLLEGSAGFSVNKTAWASGMLVGFASNLTNNLPSGLVAGQVIQSGQVPEIIRRSILIGIDLGPNLSVTGSLATILWLVALKREGIEVSTWQFLKLGMLLMTIALVASIGALWL